MLHAIWTECLPISIFDSYFASTYLLPNFGLLALSSLSLSVCEEQEEEMVSAGANLELFVFLWTGL